MAEEPEIKLPTFMIIEKAREFQKNIYCCIIDCTKPLCGSQQTMENSLRRWEYQTTLPVF